MKLFKWKRSAEDELIQLEVEVLRTRLTRIAALETPRAAHGVRKAARIARGEG